jgi:hypothetical protein
VIDAQPKLSSDGESWKNWSVEISYSYAAAGEYYSGTHRLPPESEDEAAEVALRWKDRNLVVRYSPRDASESVVLMHNQTPAAISALENSRRTAQ